MAAPGIHGSNIQSSMNQTDQNRINGAKNLEKQQQQQAARDQELRSIAEGKEAIIKLLDANKRIAQLEQELGEAKAATAAAEAKAAAAAEAKAATNGADSQNNTDPIDAPAGRPPLPPPAGPSGSCLSPHQRWQTTSVKVFAQMQEIQARI